MSNDRNKSKRIPTGLLPSRRTSGLPSLPSPGRLTIGRLTGAPRLPRKPASLAERRRANS